MHGRKRIHGSNASVLEASYITQLLAEKEQAQALINADRSRTVRLNKMRGPQRQETREERDQRHMRYLNQLLASKDEQIKRKLLDAVDSIHREEQDALEVDLEKCKCEMRRWEKRAQEPVNFDVFVINRLAQIEKEAQKKH